MYPFYGLFNAPCALNNYQIHCLLKSTFLEVQIVEFIVLPARASNE